MKHIKTFENSIQDYNNVYYKIIIDGSWDKFVIALEKLGLKDNFYYSWGIKGFDDIFPENKKYFLKKQIFLGIYNTDIIFVRNYADEFTKLKYNGTIKIEDWELSAKKYNL